MLHFTRWKTISIWAVVLLAVIVALPNLLSPSVLSSMPNWLPKRQLALGLDLQGGSHILLQIDRDDLIGDRVESVRDEIRAALRDARIGYTGLADSGTNVQVRIRDAEQIEAAKTALSSLTQPVSSGMFGAGSIIELEMTEPEPGLLRFRLTEEGITYRVSTALSQSVEVVNRRVNELGTTEPIIQRQGSDRILVQVPGLDDPQRLKDILGQTAKLTFQMVDQSMPVEEALQGRPPAGTSVMYSNDEPPVPYVIENRIIVSGENLVDAQATFDQRTSEPVVSFRFDGQGATRFGQATQQNVGRPFAIVLDNKVISAPRINEPILGGSGQISGNFTVQSANDLAVLLRAGALPADLTIIEERTVGPSLGQDSIEAGTFATGVAALIVVAFMVFAYGKLGVLASIGLAANLIMIIGVLTTLGATLTLPGIAGIALTLGMAVDSNVIIYERVREERAQGRSLIQSLDSGFQRALAAVVDANVTTLIAAVILFYMGTGPIRGFAVTLAIGIVTTVFTAFTLTRWMIAAWVRRNRPTDFPAGLVHYLPLNPKLDIMRWRKLAFGFSGAAVIAIVVGFFVVEMNYGIDFRGGSLIEVQARNGDADAATVRERLGTLGIGEVQVQEFSIDELMIRVEGQAEGGDSAEQSVVTKVRGALEADYEFRRVEVVGPTVSSELAWTGAIGVIASMIAMLIYIWIRFEWQFGVGAIVSTLHDVILIVGLFVFFGFEFNLASIAAILTVVGYSINDTVVIYDRVRENMRRYKKMPLVDLVNLSLSQTLSRTFLTGLTTLFALAVLYMWGGEVISDFMLTILVGVVVGTFSSLFIAAPLLILFNLRPAADDVEGAPARSSPGKSVSAKQVTSG